VPDFYILVTNVVYMPIFGVIVFWEKYKLKTCVSEAIHSVAHTSCLLQDHPCDGGVSEAPLFGDGSC
jgi:hypothetical protein